MIFEELDVFRKDLKKLSKKYRSIYEDVDVVKKVLDVYPDERSPFSFRIDNLGINTCIIKVKKIASKSFKGKGIQSGFRIVYAHFPDDKIIILIEIYHKSHKDVEDRDRILSNFK
nr:hypothetical protein [Bacteroidota bacterium]